MKKHATSMPGIFPSTQGNSSRKEKLLLEEKSLSSSEHPVFSIRDLNVFYNDKQALFDVSLDIERHKVMALIGASGCGKSTFLRCLNRMNDIILHTRIEGEILYNGQNINRLQAVELRSKVGMVFQRANPFPRSIYENVAYGLRLHGLCRSRHELDQAVESSLRRVGLWDEVSDRLGDRASRLSGGQQQRLCIARALSIQPDVLLMDEPCSALDPVATSLIEQLIEELSTRYAIIIVTHSMQQAARISQRTAFFYLGKIIEIGETEDLFTQPKDSRTENYLTGRFG